MAMHRRPPGVEPPAELFEFGWRNGKPRMIRIGRQLFNVGRRRGVPGLLSIRIRR